MDFFISNDCKKYKNIKLRRFLENFVPTVTSCWCFDEVLLIDCMILVQRVTKDFIK
jgi:hypothetical protein